MAARKHLLRIALVEPLLQVLLVRPSRIDLVYGVVDGNVRDARRPLAEHRRAEVGRFALVVSQSAVHDVVERRLIFTVRTGV